jgi:hypothetical protein
MDIPNLPGGADAESKRGRWIRGGEIQYAIYSPLALPNLGMGAFQGYRTPTRGWYWYGGFVQSDNVYGLRTVVQQDIYLGSRFEGVDAWDITVQGSLHTTDTLVVDANRESLPKRKDPTQSASNVRGAVIVQYRLLNQDVYPHVQPSAGGFAPDMLHLVVPLSFDRGISGPENFNPLDEEDHTNDYWNVRAGAELWYKMYQLSLGGTAFLMTAGYDFQIFPELENKVIHNVHANVRMGWGDFL